MEVLTRDHRFRFVWGVLVAVAIGVATLRKPST
jgi:hypothetical protein